MTGSIFWFPALRHVATSKSFTVTTCSLGNWLIYVPSLSFAKDLKHQQILSSSYIYFRNGVFNIDLKQNGNHFKSVTWLIIRHMHNL